MIQVKMFSSYNTKAIQSIHGIWALSVLHLLIKKVHELDLNFSNFLINKKNSI